MSFVSLLVHFPKRRSQSHFVAIIDAKSVFFCCSGMTRWLGMPKTDNDDRSAEDEHNVLFLLQMMRDRAHSLHQVCLRL